MKNQGLFLLACFGFLTVNDVLAQAWTTLGGNYLRTDASTDGVVIGNIGSSPSPTVGLLVDGAMMGVEMMVRKLEEGYDKMRAATFAYDITAMPMLTGTLITAAGFLPIGIAKSVTGEYTFAIFAVVTLALLISWVAAVTVTPFLGNWILKGPQHEHAIAGHDVFNTRFYNRLRGVIEWCLAHRKLTMLATLGLFALGGLGR